MPKYKANRNLTINEGQGPVMVSKGDVFEVSEKYHNEHLADFDHAEETDEPVTAAAKAEEKKAKKLSAKEQKEADKKAKADAKKDKE